MQRIGWIERRLHDWAQWRCASEGGAHAPRDYDYVESSNSDRLTMVEINAAAQAEALEMDQAIASLPKDLSRVIVAYYLWEGGMSMIEEKLRITRATVHRRLCHADLRIAAWFEAREAMRASLRRHVAQK